MPPTLSPPGARHISWSGLKAGTRQAGFRCARGGGESSLVNLNKIGQTVIFDNFSFGTSSFANVNRFKKQDHPPILKKTSIKDNSQASKTFQPLATGAWAEGKLNLCSSRSCLMKQPLAAWLSRCHSNSHNLEFHTFSRGAVKEWRTIWIFKLNKQEKWRRVDWIIRDYTSRLQCFTNTPNNQLLRWG